MNINENIKTKTRHDGSYTFNSALWRLRQTDLFEFEASLIQITHSIPAKAI